MVGVFTLHDATERFWNGDALWIDGVRPGQALSVRGPFVVSQETFLRDMTTRPAQMTWRLFPAFEHVSVANLPELRGRTQSLGGRLSGGEAQVSVTTGFRP